MSLEWFKRKTRLGELLQINNGSEEEEGLALDRLLHGQSVIGQTSLTREIDSLRFQNKDLAVMGTLDRGQFGLIEVVRCRVDGRVFVRKSIEKQNAIRNRQQCSPQFERDILLLARKGRSSWVPNLLSAYHTATHLNLVMDYAEGGSLWDVLASSPFEGRITESDLRWWAPQVVSAIDWCHSQGFAHRDIKPHNFVLKQDGHLLLIDFGSAAPLLPPSAEGDRRIAKEYCKVPCGTCDYISPEILKAHERALVALEMEDLSTDGQSYGLETDWWSMGAMFYEMVYGIAPFFAEEVRQTYANIVEHKTSLRFSTLIRVTNELVDLLCGLLTDAEFRLGRCSVQEITEHPFFAGIDWQTLHLTPPSMHLHVPQFTYSDPQPQPTPFYESDDSYSQPFAFSAFFQSSPGSIPNISTFNSSPPRIDKPLTFIGFSWGPTIDAFDQPNTPEPLNHTQPPLTFLTPKPSRPSQSTLAVPIPTPAWHPFRTPMNVKIRTPGQSVPRPGTIHRTLPRRAVSDREAMKQLVDCVGMSARKIVLESGRKPRILNSFANISRSFKKELRFKSSSTIDPPGLESDESEEWKFSGTEDTDSEPPPSPSPSPRPGSVMSRRSATPTLTATFSQRLAMGNQFRSNTTSLILPSIVTQEETRYPEEQDSFFTSQWDGLKSPTLVDEAFDVLEAKHVALMDDIRNVEDKLGNVSVLLGQQRSM